MKTIYIVIAITDYEGYDMLKAFEKYSEAEKLCNNIKEYEKNRQPMLDFEASEEDEDEWDKWYGNFVVSHPARPYHDADRYEIRELDLF